MLSKSFLNILLSPLPMQSTIFFFYGVCALTRERFACIWDMFKFDRFGFYFFCFCCSVSLSLYLHSKASQIDKTKKSCHIPNGKCLTLVIHEASHRTMENQSLKVYKRKKKGGKKAFHFSCGLCTSARTTTFKQCLSI